MSCSAIRETSSITRWEYIERDPQLGNIKKVIELGIFNPKCDVSTGSIRVQGALGKRKWKDFKIN